MGALLAENVVALQNDLLPLCQATRCALLAATASVRRRCRRVSPGHKRARFLRTIKRRRTSIVWKDGSRARFAWLRTCARRSRAHVRERESLRAWRRVPTQIPQDRNIHCVYDPHPFLDLANCLEIGSCPNTQLAGGSSQVHVHIHESYKVHPPEIRRVLPEIRTWCVLGCRGPGDMDKRRFFWIRY